MAFIIFAKFVGGIPEQFFIFMDDHLAESLLPCSLNDYYLSGKLLERESFDLHQ